MNGLSNAKQLKNDYTKVDKQEVCRYGRGQVFGELEFLQKEKAQGTVICESLIGELICVKLNEFQKKVKSNDAGFKALVFNAETKRQKINKLKEITEELQKERFVVQ